MLKKGNLKTRWVLLLLPLLVALVIVESIFWLYQDWDGIKGLYQEGVRNSFFTGFLTVGGFLLSLKTFIVIKLKENIYDHKEYVERLKMHRKVNDDISHYGPLQRFNNLLFYAIFAALIASCSQLTVGLIDSVVAVFVVMLMSAYTMCLLLEVLFHMRVAMKDWFTFLEKTSDNTNRDKFAGDN